MPALSKAIPLQVRLLWGTFCPCYRLTTHHPTKASQVLSQETKIVFYILEYASPAESTFNEGSYERSLSCIRALMILRKVCRCWRDAGSTPELWETLFHPALNGNLLGLVMSLAGTRLRVCFKQQKHKKPPVSPLHYIAKDDPEVDLCHASWLKLFASMELVTELRMEFLECSPRPFVRLPDALQKPLPALRKLAIILQPEYQAFERELGRLLSGDTGHLRSLELGNCVIDDFGSLRQLEDLEIKGHSTRSSKMNVPWSLISGRLPNLRTLSLHDQWTFPWTPSRGTPLKLPISLRTLTICNVVDQCLSLLQRVELAENCDVSVHVLHKQGIKDDWAHVQEIVQLVLSRAGNNPIKEFTLEVGVSPAVRVVHQTAVCTTALAIELPQGTWETDVAGARASLLEFIDKVSQHSAPIISVDSWLSLSLHLDSQPLCKREKYRYLEVLKLTILRFNRVCNLQVIQYDDAVPTDTSTFEGCLDLLGLFTIDEVRPSPSLFQLTHKPTVVLPLNRGSFPDLERVRFVHPMRGCASQSVTTEAQSVWSRFEHTCKPGTQCEFQLMNSIKPSVQPAEM